MLLPTCVVGTFVQHGGHTRRHGECWLSAHDHTKAHTCSRKPCTSFRKQARQQQTGQSRQQQEEEARQRTQNRAAADAAATLHSGRGRESRALCRCDPARTTSKRTKCVFDLLANKIRVHHLDPASSDQGTKGTNEAHACRVIRGHCKCCDCSTGADLRAQPHHGPLAALASWLQSGGGRRRRRRRRLLSSQ